MLTKTSAPHASRGVAVASYVLMAAGLLLVMWQHLLPSLLCVCLGFFATRWLARVLGNALTRLRHPRPALAGVLAVALILLVPLLLLALGLSQSRALILDAPDQYRELLNYIARTVLELRDKLPPDLAAYLPDGTDEVQRITADYLRAKGGTLAQTGQAWLHTLLFTYVGLIVGSLAALATPPLARLPLAQQMHRRISLFGDAFMQIVAAQFWIAAFNTMLTALFLLLTLPLAHISLPYRPALITLTFVAGLIPIVGNLVCNAVITLVALSVSPMAAIACLGFLVLIHKAEYVINAKVVGTRTHMAVWELLAVMFVAEAVFGPAGLVAAPLFYAYIKKELQANSLV